MDTMLFYEAMLFKSMIEIERPSKLQNLMASLKHRIQKS